VVEGDVAWTTRCRTLHQVTSIAVRLRNVLAQSV
jgi:hypothetical protein